jgi:hypothetical protein
MKNTTLIKDLGDALEPQTNLWTEIKSN